SRPIGSTPIRPWIAGRYPVLRWGKRTLRESTPASAIEPRHGTASASLARVFLPLHRCSSGHLLQVSIRRSAFSERPGDVEEQAPVAGPKLAGKRVVDVEVEIEIEHVQAAANAEISSHVVLDEKVR